MNGPTLWRPLALAGGLMLAVCLGGCSRGTAPEPVKAKTTWDDVVAAKLAMREEMTAAVEQLRKQHPGRIPIDVRKSFLDSVRVMDERLQMMVKDATRDRGPPPLSIVATTNASLMSEAHVELARIPPPSRMAQGGMMPPGSMPPGMMPPGMMPSGAIPPGALGVPRGAMPSGPFPPGPGAVAGIDVEGLQKVHKLQIEAEIRKSKREGQAKEADRIQKLIDGYLKSPHRFSDIQKRMTAEQREVVREMQKVIVSLRGDDLSHEDQVALLEKQAELEQRYNELGDVEVERLKAIAAAEQKERQRQALALVAEANRVQEAHALEMAKINADRAAAAAKADAEYTARVNEINREAEAARKAREAHLFTEMVNKERAKRNLPPLKEAFQPVRAPLTDRAIAPGFEVSEVSQLKPRDAIYVHFDGKWHDATVQTKRGKIVTVKYVALENLENVTIERIRTHNRPDEPSKAARPAAAKQAEQVAQVKSADAPAPLKPPEDPPTRVWTSSSGTQVDAALIGREGDVVQLKRTDGLVIKVPIHLLAEADQKIIRTIFPK